MINLNREKNSLVFINNIYFIILVVLSFYFGKERSVFFDGADWIYEIILNKNNYVPHYRFSIAINGIIPWLCSYFTTNIHLILNAFILNYSITPVVIFVLLRYYFKSEFFVTLFLLGHCFFYSMVFFHPNHDALTGYLYLILYTSFIVLKYPNEDKNYYVLLSIFSLLVVLTHLTQYIFLLIITVYVYFFVNSKFSIMKNLVINFSLLIFKMLILSSGYEVGLYSKVQDVFGNINLIFHNNLVTSFYKSLLSYNLPFLFLLIFVTIILFLRKKYIKILFVLLPVLFILYFMAFYFGSWSNSFAIEGYFKGAIIIPMFIFLKEFILKNEKMYSFKILFVLFFYLSSIFLLINHGNRYVEFYNNINLICKRLDMNTIYDSDRIDDREEFYVTHRYSAFINMIENGQCFYYQIKPRSTKWNNDLYFNDITKGGFCFGDSVAIVKPSAEIIENINAQHDLIFNF